ncbi:MAG: hypothetical protein M0C28_30945 [Candidatus Moduliflexus flocculans]|nr:hypothetical protein [Candidatus Moduliflexus flocculans]
MRLDPRARAEIVGKHRADAGGSGMQPQLIEWDHNWDEVQAPLAVLADPVARQYIAGTGWHCYGGQVQAQSVVHDAHPEKDTWFTECSGGQWAPGWPESPPWVVRNPNNGATRHARGVLMNLALDEERLVCTWAAARIAAASHDDSRTGAVTRNLEYYAPAHASRFRAAWRVVRVESTAEVDNLQSVAFRNDDDGSIVLIVCNSVLPPRLSRCYQPAAPSTTRCHARAWSRWCGDREQPTSGPDAARSRWPVACAVRGHGARGGAHGDSPSPPFPLVDEIAARRPAAVAAVAIPDVDIKVVSRQFADHHTAMTTALSTSLLPARRDGAGGRATSAASRRAAGSRTCRASPTASRASVRAWCPTPTTRPPTAAGAVVADADRHRPGHAALPRRHPGPGRRRRGRADPLLGQLRRRRRAHQGRHRRLPDRRMRSEIKDILIRTGIQPGEGLYFDNESQRARHVAALRARLRARAPGAAATSSTPASAAWSNEWAEGFKRGTLATAVVRRLAGRPPEQLAGAADRGPVARGATARRRLRRLRRHLLRHPARLDAGQQGAGLGVHPADDAATASGSSLAFKSQDAFPALLETYDDPFFERADAPSSAARRRACCWRAAAQPHRRPSPCTSRTALPTRWSAPSSTTCSIAARTSALRWRTRSACSSGAPIVERQPSPGARDARDLRCRVFRGEPPSCRWV